MNSYIVISVVEPEGGAGAATICGSDNSGSKPDAIGTGTSTWIDF
jgi:hypothetical protein